MGFGGALAAGVVRLALLATLVLAALACNGDDAASPTPAPTASSSPATKASPTLTASRGWRRVAPMPTPRSEVAAAELNGKIYVIGGFEGDGSASDKVEVYDPANDSWREVSPLPAPRHHAATFVFGTLFVVGGFESGFNDPKDTIYQYDEAADKWTEVTPLPEPRGALGVADVLCNQPAFLNACIYAVGGVGADGKNIAVVAFNDPTAGWSEVAPLPTPRDHLAVVVFNDRIYAIGGRRDTDFGRNLDANEEYDPATNTWTPRSPLPTARSGIAAAELAGRIYVFGGEGTSGTFNQNEAYDPATDTWETLEPMPTARHGLGAAVVGDTIYVIGGGPTPGGSVSSANEAFTP